MTVPGKPTDFDALLAALGAADAEPPPLMKQLLAGVGQRSQSHDFDSRVLAELEAWLAAIVDERSSYMRSR